jgi:hypothetical protein
MCLWVRVIKKYEEKLFFFASLKSLKRGVASGVGSGSGSISQRCGFRSKCHGSPKLPTIEKAKEP